MKKKKRISTIVVLLAMFAGLSLLLYPTVSNYIQTLYHRQTISSYVAEVGNIDAETYAKILGDAEAYNKDLADGKMPFLILEDEDKERYESLLNINGNGVMGYIQIPVIDVSLPIYHTCNEAVLQIGVGHLEGSSLPIGGEGTHTLLSGHRGLPSATLFTNLDKLEIGDTFTIRVLREALTYEIDDISEVLPYELSSLTIDKNADYCTLVTCTPYGVNTHRLLVRGHRIPTPEDETLDIYPLAEASQVMPLLPAFTASVPIMLIAVICAVVLHKRKHRKEQKQ